jgi:hypothetical protein
MFAAVDFSQRCYIRRTKKTLSGSSIKNKKGIRAVEKEKPLKPAMLYRKLHEYNILFCLFRSACTSRV